MEKVLTELEKRFAALSEYMVMDTPPEQAFDDLTRLTSHICGTPIALVSLLDHKRQWFKSKVGTALSETPLDHAFCRYAIEQKDVMLVPDALQDQRFAASPLVTGDPHVRFYAGAPLITEEGVALGTLCAIDQVPRKMKKDQVAALEILARSVISALELRKKNTVLTRLLEEKKEVEKHISDLKALLPMCAWCRKVRDDDNYWKHVEFYVSQHSDLMFTHGMCPDCALKIEKEFRDRPKRPPF